MDYFELFELPVSLKADNAVVLKKYYALSRQFHPDRFSLQDTAAQNEALTMSAHVNEAKGILDDPYKRLAYILREQNMLEQEEKYALPPIFLAQMMDINEQLMENPSDDQKQKIKALVQEIADDIFSEVSSFFEQDILDCSAEVLQKLKDYYFKKKYLNRIVENF